MITLEMEMNEGILIDVEYTQTQNPNIVFGLFLCK